MPKWLEEEIQKDNIEFALDRQLFNKQFFQLVDTMLKYISSTLVMTQSQHPPEYRDNYRRLKMLGLQIGHKVMFDFISHASKNEYGASI